MADSLLASLFGMLDSHSVGGIAGSLAASEQSVGQGLKSSIASVLGGMASKSNDPTALRSILDLAPSATGDTTVSQIARAASDPDSPLISGGRRLLSGLFRNAEPAVTDAVSAASGLRPGTTSTVLALAAPMVMSFLNKRVRAEGMNMGGLGSLLQRENGAIRSALPAGLADIFWPSTVRTAAPVGGSDRAERTLLPLASTDCLGGFGSWIFMAPESRAQAGSSSSRSSYNRDGTPRNSQPRGNRFGRYGKARATGERRSEVRYGIGKASA